MSEIRKDLIPSEQYHLQYIDGASITKRGLELANKLSPNLGIVKSEDQTKKTGILNSTVEVFNIFKDFQKIKIWEIREKRRVLFGDKWSDSSRQREWKKLIRTDPENAEAYYRLGNAHFEKGKYKKAITYYTVALDKQSDFVDALRRRGDCYYAQLSLVDFFFNKSKAKELSEQALSDYQAAVSLEKDVYTSNAMGILYELFEKWDEALDCYTQAIELNPNYSESYYNRAKVFIGLEEKQKALSDIEKYISFDSWHKKEMQAAIERLATLQNEMNSQNISQKILET